MTNNNFSGKIRPKQFRKKRNNTKFLSVVIPLIAVIAILLITLLLNWRIIIKINSDNPIAVNIGSTFSPGKATAMLALGDKELLPLDVDVSGTPDTSSPGEYSVKYSSHFLLISDSVKQTVVVKDTVAPTVTLNGEEALTVNAGEAFNDPGANASDNIDGNISDNIIVDGSVDTATPGQYVLTYISTDSAGNQSAVSRTVTVLPQQQPTEVDPNQKAIYLTFDDGPGDYTAQLLDILKARNVKVTFFVTGRGDSSLIKREFDEGHTVAVHTYCHDYGTIYSSDEAYLEDFKQMEDLIFSLTGSKSTVFRFPGGSSNTVSANYSSGIMSRLSATMTAKGYQYYDWNISSGDAGEVTSADAVFNNVTENIAYSSSNTNIVLQHDIKDFSVDAVDRIIEWGLQNGYVFLPITSSTPTVHHGINN